MLNQKKMYFLITSFLLPYFSTHFSSEKLGDAEQEWYLHKPLRYCSSFNPTF